MGFFLFNIFKLLQKLTAFKCALYICSGTDNVGDGAASANGNPSSASDW